MFSRNVKSNEIKWTDTSVHDYGSVYTIGDSTVAIPKHGTNPKGQTNNKFVLSVSDPLAFIDVNVQATSLPEPLRSFEQSRRSKVGKQGLAFPMAYVFEQAFVHFVKHHHDGRLLSMPVSKRRAAELYAMLLPDGGYIVPYTVEETAQRLAKTTAAFGFKGDKASPEVLAEAIRWAYDILSGKRDIREVMICAVGQRYQRNKKDEFKNPIPRCIFNPHFVYCILLGRYIFPLIDAAKKAADTSAPLATPYSPMRGPITLGRDLYEWTNLPSKSGKPVSFYKSYNFDLRHCDANFGKSALELGVELTQECFAPEERGNYRQMFMTVLQLTVAFDDKHAFTPVEMWDCLFSGLIPTNFIESTVLWAIIKSLLETSGVALVLPDPKGDPNKVKSYKINTFDEVAIIVNGDDVSILVKCPAQFTLIGGRRKDQTLIPFESLVVSTFQAMGFESALDKCSVLENRWLYGMKMYGEAIAEDKFGKRFLPVYSMTAALNAILNPEMPPVGTNEEELKRVAMIMDQTVGHPKFNQVVQNMANMMKAKLGSDWKSEILRLYNTLDSVNLSALHRAYSFQDVEWNAEDSVFMITLLLRLGLTEAEIESGRYVGTLLRKLRVALWQLRCTVDEDGKLTDHSIETIENVLTMEQSSYAFEELLAQLTPSADSDAKLRMPMNYCHHKTFAENCIYDVPSDHYITLGTGKNQSIDVESIHVVDESNPLAEL